MTESRWESAYTGGESAPWDIGRPQPAFARLAERGLLAGRVLDAGCGTGEHALLAAASGAEVTGVDVARAGVRLAREKASARGLTVRFEVADALHLEGLGLDFDTVIDSGLFHVFDDEDRASYVRSLARVLVPGGTCYLMCFSELQPGDFGPRRVSQDELRAAFADGFAVASIVASSFELQRWAEPGTALAWLATISRQDG